MNLTNEDLAVLLKLTGYLSTRTPVGNDLYDKLYDQLPEEVHNVAEQLVATDWQGNYIGPVEVRRV